MTPIDADLEDLSTLLPAPPTALLTDDERTHVDRRLAALLRADREREQLAARRREAGSRAAAPALVAACVAGIVLWGAAAMVGDPSGSVPDDRPVVAAPRAVNALDQAAQAVVLNTSGTSLEGGRFGYTRSIVVSNNGEIGNGPVLGAPHEREIWVSQDPQPLVGIGLIREYGQDWPIEGGAPVPPGPGRPTYEWLDSLPTDPDRLLAEIESDIGVVDSDLEHDHVVFSRICDLVAESLVPPRVAAALFEAATRVPGVTFEADATDAIGRRGVGIAHEDDVVRTVLVLDPTDYRVLGLRDYFVTSNGPVLYGATAVLERSTASQAGEAPDSLATAAISSRLNG